MFSIHQRKFRKILLLFFVLFIESNRSVSRISFPHWSDCSFVVLILTKLRNSRLSTLVFKFKVSFKECFVKCFVVIRYFFAVSYFFSSGFGFGCPIFFQDSFIAEVHKYRNPFTDLQSKSMDWFLYDRDLRHERVKNNFIGFSPYSYHSYSLFTFMTSVTWS